MSNSLLFEQHQPAVPELMRAENDFVVISEMHDGLHIFLRKCVAH
jgi:hypothetical protein